MEARPGRPSPSEDKRPPLLLGQGPGRARDGKRGIISWPVGGLRAGPGGGGVGGQRGMRAASSRWLAAAAATATTTTIDAATAAAAAAAAAGPAGFAPGFRAAAGRPPPPADAGRPAEGALVWTHPSRFSGSGESV